MNIPPHKTVATGLLLAAMLLSATPASAASSNGADIQFEPFPSPPGTVTTQTQDLADRLAAIVDQSPDGMAGVRIDGPNAITLTIPPNADATAAQGVIKREAAQFSQAGAAPIVRVQRAGRSRAELTKVRADIENLWRAGTWADKVTGVGTDSVRGVAVVYTVDDSVTERKAIKARFGDAVVFRHMEVPKAAEADRSRDTAAHFGGAGIYMWNVAHTGRRGWCSTSFPVVLDGQRYMLTAGHCLPGSTQHPRAWASAFTAATPVPSSSYYFGNLYTTTLAGTMDSTSDGTQDRYGDWAIMSGSTYAPYVYNCANLTGSCTSLPVGAASWTTPVLGAAICTSGWTTAQICRQYVVDTDCTCAVAYSGGTANVAHIAIFRSDQNNDGAYDCNTTRGGDSGGAVYQGISGRPGYVRALGNVTAGDDCTSYYTKLEGLRAWNSSFSMPTL